MLAPSTPSSSRITGWGRLEPGQPVHQRGHQAEQQRLGRRNAGREQHDGEQVRSHAVGAAPQEGEEARRRRAGGRLGIGVDEALEARGQGLEQRHPASVAGPC
jgi:hypothetical protein